MVAAGCSIIGISSGIWWMKRRWASSISAAGVPPPASHSPPQVETVLSIPPWQVRMLPMPVVHQPSLLSISAPPLSWEILLFPNGPDVPKPSQPILPADLPPKATYRKDADILAASGATQAVRACLIAGVSIGVLIASASVLQLWKCRQIAQCLQRASAYPGYELSIAQREVGQSLTVPSCTGINAKPLSEFPGKSVNTNCAPLSKGAAAISPTKSDVANAISGRLALGWMDPSEISTSSRTPCSESGQDLWASPGNGTQQSAPSVDVEFSILAKTPHTLQPNSSEAHSRTYVFDGVVRALPKVESRIFRVLPQK